MLASVTHRNYSYRLKLRPSQHRALEAVLEAQRLLYNAALQERCDAWAKARCSISYVDQCYSLTQIRRDDETFRSLPMCLSRGTLKRLDLAFQAFFRRVKAGQTPGFPRFKPMSRFDSIAFTEMKGIRLLNEARRLTISGLPGTLRIVRHRPLPEGATPKSAILRRVGRQWELSLLVAIPLLDAAAWTPIEAIDRPDIGLDTGIESFLTASDGSRIAGPEAGKQVARQQRRLQRALARKRRGSRRRHRAKAQLAALMQHTANRRRDHAHKLSAQLARRYRCIAVEKLQVANMSRSAKGSVEAPGKNVQSKAGLNRAILDQGWSDFLFKLSYKAESAGGRVIEVSPKGTSQRCSACGAHVAKSLAQRVHRCACGAVLHRDHNAALNILQSAAREGKLPPRLQPVAGQGRCRDPHAILSPHASRAAA